MKRPAKTHAPATQRPRTLSDRQLERATGGSTGGPATLDGLVASARDANLFS
jgi:hypothetical protein